jgi:hypothetical protein
MYTRVQELFQYFLGLPLVTKELFHFFWVTSRNQNSKKTPPHHPKISTKFPEHLDVQYERIEFS